MYILIIDVDTNDDNNVIVRRNQKHVSMYIVWLTIK